ncbi:MAG: hypothetical protein RLY20_3328 [Verrucomicrobiota bacterium]
MHTSISSPRHCVFALSFLSVVVCFTLLRLDAPAGTNAVPGATFRGEFYPANTLGYALESNYQRLTNAIRGYQPWNDQPWLGYQWMSTNVAAYRLNPRSVIFGKRGATALSLAQFNSTQNHLCAVTRRHAIGTAHWGDGASLDNQIVWFMGTNGMVHGMRTTNCFADKSVTKEFEDMEVVQFTQDLPADVEVMRVAGPLTNSWRGFAAYFSPSPEPGHLPILMLCQHGYLGRGGQQHVGSPFGVGGDSGSPSFIIHGDELINVGGLSPYPSPQMQRKIDELCRRSGLNPARYQMQVVSLTNYPQWPY